jgi:hypothetical protein
MNERLKNAMDAEARQQAVVAYARANDNKWNSIQAIMGQLGNQRRALKEDAWGPLAYVNTTTGGRARYLDAPDEKGGRGPVVSAGWQPQKIDGPSAEDVAQIFTGSRRGRSVPDEGVPPKPRRERRKPGRGGVGRGGPPADFYTNPDKYMTTMGGFAPGPPVPPPVPQPTVTASKLSPIQQQLSDAMGGAASGIMAQKNAEISRGAEINEMANKTAASQQGLDLAKLAMGLGSKERAIKQGLDKQMVAGILPAMAAKTPPILQQGLRKAYTG